MTLRGHIARYTDYGFCLVPVHPAVGGRCACGRVDCLEPGKHRAGQAAARSEDEALAWMRAGFGLAVLTGESGLIVLDIDDGTDPGIFPRTFCVGTPRGCHLYYRADGPARRGVLRAGIEILAEHRHAVLPPSRHASGARYTIVNPHPPAPAPTWLRWRVHPTLYDYA